MVLLQYHNYLKKFLRVDKSIKLMILEALFLSAIYRFLILHIKFKKLSKNIGEKNIESSLEGTKEGYLIGRKISMVVNKTLEITPWESKCLVKAVTAKKMMKKRGYKTTLYLGVGKDEEGVNAHAWLRYGKVYLTGGDGSNHSMVAYFS